MSEAAPEGDRVLLRQVLPVLIIISMIGPLALNIIMPSIPGLAQSLQAERSEVQLVLSLFLAAQAIGQLFIGTLADRYGRRPVLVGALGLYVTASIAASFATSIGFLVTARVFQAFGAVAGLTLSRTVVRDLAPRDLAASMIGYVTSGMVVAPLVAPALGGLIDETFGWRAIFFVCAGLGAVALALSLARLPETRPASIVGQGFAEVLHRSATVCRNRRFLGYALGAGMTSGVFFAFLGAAPYLVIETLQLPKTAYGLWFIAMSVGYMTGNYCAGRLSERLGIDRMILAGSILSILGASVFLALALTMPLSPATLFLPNFFVALGNGFLLPNAVAGAVSVDPKAAGAASGMAGFMQFGIGALASFVSGQIVDGSSLPLGMMMLTMTLAAWAFLADARRRPG